MAEKDLAYLAGLVVTRIKLKKVAGQRLRYRITVPKGGAVLHFDELETLGKIIYEETKDVG